MSRPSFVRPVLAGLCALAALSPCLASADEGMWTFNGFPAKDVKAKYGFEPSQAWLDHLRLSSLRIAGGCSASVVSPDGLVMTNHHCVRSCVAALSGLAGKDYARDGFLARSPAEERRCDTFELNQLLEITDVTAKVQAVTQGAPPEKFAELQKAAISGLEKACTQSDDTRCEVVSLYRGGRYDLYRYRRFTDVRLVFAPEEAVAHFGGDPDNFNFPRYGFDAAFLRLRGKDGAPVKLEHALSFSTIRLTDGTLTFISGHPGSTGRLMTVAQLEDDRDFRLPFTIARLSEQRGWLSQYQLRGTEQKRHSNVPLYRVENSLKAFKGRHAALADPDFFARLQQAEASFRKQIDAKPVWKKEFGGAFTAIEAATRRGQQLRVPYQALESAFGGGSELFSFARLLVRAGDELPKPNAERLKEYAEARVPQLKQALSTKNPIYDELELERLAFGLTKLREDLGPDHPVVKQVLGLDDPRTVATRLVKGTRLQDPQVRTALFEGGRAAIEASADLLLRLARTVDAPARELRKRWEDEVEGPTKKNAELVARARFLVYGTTVPPDATFTLRLTYGQVKGFPQGGVEVPPITTLAGGFDRHTGQDPFALPASWLAAKSRLPLDTPFDVATTNDIIGGNSGSPVVDAKGEVVGLVFDGNLASLGGEYAFDPATNRAVLVSAEAIVAVLRTVYGADALAAELTTR